MDRSDMLRSPKTQMCYNLKTVLLCEEILPVTPRGSEERTISHILKNQYGSPTGRVPHVFWRSCKSWLDWLSESSDVHRWFTIPSVLSIFSQGKVAIKNLVFKFRFYLTYLDHMTPSTDPCGKDREATWSHITERRFRYSQKAFRNHFLFLFFFTFNTTPSTNWGVFATGGRLLTREGNIWIPLC